MEYDTRRDADSGRDRPQVNIRLSPRSYRWDSHHRHDRIPEKGYDSNIRQPKRYYVANAFILHEKLLDNCSVFLSAMELSVQYRESMGLDLGGTHRPHICTIKVSLPTRDKQYSLASIGRRGFEREDLVLLHPFLELAKFRSLTEYQICRRHWHAER